MLFELSLGLLAGGIHTVSGADHLAAMAPLALRRPREGAGTGLRWGIGHGLGVAALSAAAFGLREWIAIEAWSQTAESLVGVVLIAVGIWALRSALRARLHAHPHRHPHAHAKSDDADADGVPHSHVHLHGARDAHPTGPESVPGPEHRHHHAALAVGALHGVAGTAHLAAVLPGLLLPSASALAGYLIGYGAGAALAMATFGWLTGRVARAPSFDGTRAYRVLLSTAGIGAIAVGGLWIVV